MILPTTDNALIDKIQASSLTMRKAASDQFVAIYRPAIFAWFEGMLRDTPLPVELAEDLTQELLVKLLLEKFPQRCYDLDRGRFRSWLQTTVRNALNDHLRKCERHPEFGSAAVGGTEYGQILGAVPDQLAGDLSSVIVNHPETKAAQVIARVSSQVSDKHWRAFQLVVYEQRTVAEVAAELGLRPSSVKSYNSRIKKLLEEELDRG